MVSSIGGNNPAGAHARRLPRHQPGRARRRAGHRGRGDVRPRPGAPRPGPALAGVGEPARRHAAGRRSSAWRSPAPPSSRCSAGVHPAGARLPPVRERAARRQRLDAARAPRPASAACGPASARWRPATRTPGSAPPARPRRSSRPAPANRMVSFPYPKLCTANMQVDQGAGLHRVLGRRRPAPPACPRSAGSSRCRAPTATTTGSFPSAPSCTAPPPSGWPARPRSSRPGSGIDDIALVDLYSCFPVVVQMAAAELGLAARRSGPPADADRRAHLRRRARQQLHLARHRPAPSARCATRPGARRSSAAWGGTPPSTPSGSTPRARRRTAATAALRLARRAARRSTRCPAARSTPAPPAPSASRPTPSPSTATGAPERGILACRTADGSRAWGNVSDADTLALLCAEEGIGRTGDLAADGIAGARPGRPPAPGRRLGAGGCRRRRTYGAAHGLCRGRSGARRAPRRVPLPGVRAGGPSGRPEHGAVPHPPLPPGRLPPAPASWRRPMRSPSRRSPP